MSKKSIPELGDFARSGQLVAGYLRAIGAEKDIVVVTKSGNKLVSKAEALARQIWEKALGHEDESLRLKYCGLLLDRAEGKPGIVGESGPQTLQIPNKISETNRKRLNAMVA